MWHTIQDKTPILLFNSGKTYRIFTGLVRAQEYTNLERWCKGTYSTETGNDITKDKTQTICTHRHKGTQLKPVRDKTEETKLNTIHKTQTTSNTITGSNRIRETETQK